MQRLHDLHVQLETYEQPPVTEPKQSGSLVWRLFTQSPEPVLTCYIALALLRQLSRRIDKWSSQGYTKGPLPIRRRRHRKNYANGSLLRYASTEHQEEAENTLPCVHDRCSQAGSCCQGDFRRLRWRPNSPCRKGLIEGSDGVMF